MGVAGLHLSGPNTPRTVMIQAHRSSDRMTLVVDRIFDKLGPIGEIFSDDRIVEIVRATPSLRTIFVDCPLSVPPCVACTRPVCPGAFRCDDMGVAYILSLSEKFLATQKKRKKHLNPQAQRLWDIWNWAQGNVVGYEPTYSANLAPLAVRAMTLRKRLSHQIEGLDIGETSVPLSLRVFCQKLDLDPILAFGYKTFETGSDVRAQFVEAFMAADWIAVGDEDSLNQMIRSADCFSALVTTMVADLKSADACVNPPKDFLEDQGWVYLPKHLP